MCVSKILVEMCVHIYGQAQKITDYAVGRRVYLCTVLKSGCHAGLFVFHVSQTPGPKAK